MANDHPQLSGKIKGFLLPPGGNGNFRSIRGAMIGIPRGVDNKARDHVSLKEVALFHLNLVAECTCCGHKRLMDTDLVLDLIERFGGDMTMKSLAGKLKCDLCKRKRAEILFRTGDRPDDWWPRIPQEQRH